MKHVRLATRRTFPKGRALFNTMTEPAITKEIIAKHGLTDEEYARIQGILGRDPNITELGVFSVMWSEHCSYKNTKKELRKFPTTGPLVLVKAGEDRGTARPACDPSAIGDTVAATPSSQFVSAPRSRWSRTITRAPSSKVAQCFQPVCIAV